MSEERFDCIIVGAGPAGSAAALTLARAGLEVLVIERGLQAGSKNMTGGRLYAHALQKIIPNFWEEAPVERRVVKETITMITPSGSVSLDYKSQRYNQEPYHSFTVLRAQFDQWLATKAEEAGAVIATGVRVDDLLRDDQGKIIGVIAGEDQMLANVVIAADGVNSLLAQKAGLRGELKDIHVATGVKEVIELPRQVIEDRFQLTGEEGAAQLFVGRCTQGIQGGGFLYTNKNTISIGLVITSGAIGKSKIKIADLIEEFKTHPNIAPLVTGGKVVEYSAHLVPEGGLNMLPALYTDGLLIAGDAAGLVLNTGYMVRGMDLAIYSGIAAAQTVIKAKEKEDYSKTSLSHYQELLKNSFVMKDLETYKNAPAFMEQTTRIFTTYPQLADNILYKLFTVYGTPAQHLLPMVMGELKKNNISIFDLVKDGIKGVRAL
ncbi:FAD-dependent oxidoreductase [Thermanaerosceptrum fracticalcis]|uniref:FAD-dependent oxidoreductase n=1 Tax=Thermanaerosceptrum fracticalcis TaxID=1712410 RepID=A0A7G6E6E5_THEFR|nr:FAD-dependent oxidoreductase [Thermanaerosceptrum fracticalcis]QNB47649.1 FAD-dependent oxidoreductase [Thermanaerosceptrum fracticalcis]QNB47970.1 FAD-dependent oxidoreductase [Thermanaerosceptrum fracticalcis]